MPADRLRVMEAHGEVRTVRRGGSDARSYRETLADEAAGPGEDADLVRLAEDDYLYTDDSLVRLVRTADELPHVDYPMPYGSLAVDVARNAGRDLVTLPQGGADHPDAEVVTVAGSPWFRIASTTSTFGLRRRALREDRRLLLFGALTGGAWDDSSCRMVQGFRPFEPGEIRADLVPFGREPVASRPRAITRGPVRSVAVATSRRRGGRHRVSMGSDPELAFPMEAGAVAPHPVSTRTSTTDRATVAAESAAWARAHGIAVDVVDGPGRAR